MTTMGIRPGDVVLVTERRGAQQLAYHALVAGFSMDEGLAGAHGEPAIEACFVALYAEARAGAGRALPTLTVPGVVHISHRDFVEGRAGLGYEELPGGRRSHTATDNISRYEVIDGYLVHSREGSLIFLRDHERVVEELLRAGGDGQ